MTDRAVAANLAALAMLSTIASEDEPVPEGILYMGMMEYFDQDQFEGLMQKFAEVGFLTRSNHTVTITAEGKKVSAQADAAIEAAAR